MTTPTSHIYHIKPAIKDKVCVIIPAAGNGMKSSGPKCMLRVRDKTILERQIEVFNSIFSDYYIILVTGFESEYVMDNTPSNIIKVVNERYEETNVLKSISIGLRACTCDKVFISYGDLLFNQAMLRFEQNVSTVLVKEKDGDDVGSINPGGTLNQLAYGLPYKWSQMLFLTGKELSLFKKVAFNKNKEKYFTFEAINEVVNMGGQIAVVNPKDGISKDIDCNKDIKIAQEIGL